jgi:ribosome biogenesis protein ERB1
MKRSRQIAKKVPAKAVSSEEEEEEEVQKNGPEWREVTADEWFKEEDGNSSFGDAEFGSSDEEPYDSADDEDDEEVYGSEDDEEEERAAREEEEDELNGGEEDEDEEDEDEDHDQLNPENFQKLVSWLGRHDPPEAEESEDETHNTVGNVPMHWYADYPHIGYDVEGKRIMKKQGPVKDEMDRFLDRTDDPNYWCLCLPPLIYIFNFIYLSDLFRAPAINLNLANLQRIQCDMFYLFFFLFTHWCAGTEHARHPAQAHNLR